MGKLRYGGERLANTHTARKWWIQGLNPGLLTPAHALNHPPAVKKPTWKPLTRKLRPRKG